MRQGQQVKEDITVADLTAEHIVIATGTRPARPDSVAFDGRTIMDSDNVLALERCRGRWSSSGRG